MQFNSSYIQYVPYNPTRRSDDRLVCGAHGLVVCGLCTVDYSFMDDILREDEEDSDDKDLDDEDLDDDVEDSSGDEVFRPTTYRARGMVVQAPPFGDRQLRVGSGRVIPGKFTPPTQLDTPGLLFPTSTPRKRFIHRTDPSQCLVYCDGACSGNGSQDAKGGCAFVFQPSSDLRDSDNVSFALEQRGPTDELCPHTSNRAELRAVIGALRFRSWASEGFKTIVIATDSEYVVNGATKWVKSWLRKGWRTSQGQPVKNKDLWQVLLGEAERRSEDGLDIKFWYIPRRFNGEADRLAKDAAENSQSGPIFEDLLGVLV